jgi:plasmid stability protein
VAQLLVRNIEDDVKERLRLRAARHGHSIEEEVRDILRAAADADDTARAGKGGIGSRIAARFTGLGLTEDIAELRGEAAEPAVFGPK